MAHKVYYVWGFSGQPYFFLLELKNQYIKHRYLWAGDLDIGGGDLQIQNRFWFLTPSVEYEKVSGIVSSIAIQWHFILLSRNSFPTKDATDTNFRSSCQSQRREEARKVHRSQVLQKRPRQRQGGRQADRRLRSRVHVPRQGVKSGTPVGSLRPERLQLCLLRSRGWAWLVKVQILQLISNKEMKIVLQTQIWRKSTFSLLKNR